MNNKSPYYYPHFKYGQVKLALLSEKHDLEVKNGKTPSLLLTTARMIGQIYHVFFIDKFQIERFDSLIVGGDALISLISALKLCSTGKRVLIYRNEPWDLPSGLGELFKMRHDMYDENIARYIENTLGISKKSKNIGELIESICTKIKETEKITGGSVMIIDNFSIYSDNTKTSNSKEGRYFWVDLSSNNKENSDWRSIYMSLRRLRISPPYKINVKKRSIRPVLIIEAKEIVITSVTCNKFYNDIHDIFTYIAGGQKKLTDYSKFSLKDRLLDVISSLSVEKMIADSELRNKYKETIHD